MQDPTRGLSGRVAASVEDVVRGHLRRGITVQEGVLAACVDDIVRAAELITDAFRGGGKLLICGNGGSAADAQHVAAEFVNRLTAEVERAALPALALTTDTSFLTSYANDHDYEGVFARQIEAFGRTGDVLLCISTSGSSANVVRAGQAAQMRGVRTIALVGEGGSLEAAVDVAIVVPSRVTSSIQEAMLPIEHSICELVENELFGLAGSEPGEVGRRRTPGPPTG
ncbi:MAG: D-sedoheptulose 7-phosphate isomerase [Candidatus Dormibacteria bacterium]